MLLGLLIGFIIGLGLGFGIGLQENKTLNDHIDQLRQDQEDPADWWKKGEIS